MLIGNGSVLHKIPVRFMAGTTTSVEPQLRAAFGKQGMLRNRFYQNMATTALRKYSIAEGTYAGTAWMLPQTGGALASFSQINGAGAAVGAGSLGLPAAASIGGAGDITAAFLALVVSAVANISGAGGLTADIVGKLEAAAVLAGAGDLTAALGALASLIASLAGAGTVAGAPYAAGSISADIKGYGDLTPEGIRDSVWSAILTNYPDTGTAGNTLSLAGSGGVDYHALGLAVWNILNTEADTPGTMGASVQSGGTGSGLTLAQFLALK